MAVPGFWRGGLLQAVGGCVEFVDEGLPEVGRDGLLATGVEPEVGLVATGGVGG